VANYSQFLAFDLGASNGRAIYGQLANHRFEFEEAHRFPTHNATLLGVHQWDTAAIYGELLAGMSRIARVFGPGIDSIGIDTWGVDYALLASDGSMLGNPVHYRDRRTEGMQELAFEIMPKPELYASTGIGVNRFNTLFQLLALVQNHSPLLPTADSMLMMGDLFHYLLSGQRSCEFTNASTTQLFDLATQDWNWHVIERMGLPRRIFRPIVPAGSILGPLLPEIAQATGLSPETRIITPATHDTASAIAAVPVEDMDEDWAYIATGTWAIMGAELDEPVISEASFALDFSNEGGVEGRICFHKHFIGLWLLQECRRIWSRDGEPPAHAELVGEAEAAEPFISVINVDDPRLYAPENMPELLAELCREAGQPVPETRGALVRCVLESIALKSRRTLQELESVLGRRMQRIHMVGGGVQNELLCQLTSDACGLPVYAGPTEASILGNLTIQARALGALSSLNEMRRVVAASAPIRRYLPQRHQLWNELAALLNQHPQMSRR
jgi:rhamnulokinase